MNCQEAITEKINPGTVVTKKESWYSKYELEMYFSLKGKDLKKYTKQGIIMKRIIPPRRQNHGCLFLVSDNKGVLLPKKMLKPRTVKNIRNGVTA